MKRIYLLLALIGFIAPNVLVVAESVESGNILLWTHISDTFSAMFTNRISTIFMIDLLFALVVFFIWSFSQKALVGTKKIFTTWILTLLFGLAGGLPLFLYFREGKQTNI